MKEDFRSIYQNQITNEFSFLNTDYAEVNEIGEYSIKGDLISIGGCSWSSVNTRVFDAILLKAAENHSKYVFISTKEFAELCGITERAARTQTADTAEILNTVTINSNYSHICECQKEHGGIYVELSEDFIESLTGNKGMGVMPFPLRLFRINMRKYPKAYRYGRILTVHKFMNIGKGNENSIKSNQLCGAEFDSSKCGFKSNILYPFQHNMEGLKDILSIQWNGSAPQTHTAFTKTPLSIKWKTYADDFEYIAKRRQNKKTKS